MHHLIFEGWNGWAQKRHQQRKFGMLSEHAEIDAQCVP